MEPTKESGSSEQVGGVGAYCCNGCDKKHPFCFHFFENLLVLLFEAFGTGLFTCAFISTNTGALSLLIAYFMILILCYRITGSHLNPIISLAYMIRKDPGDFHRWKGILYMLAQLGGAFVGCIMVFYWFN